MDGSKDSERLCVWPDTAVVHRGQLGGAFWHLHSVHERGADMVSRWVE